MLDKIYIV